mgnify:CR=1 FL=1
MKLEQFEKLESKFDNIIKTDYPNRDINLCYDIDEDNENEEYVDFCKIMGHQEGDEEIGAYVFETILQENLLLPGVDYDLWDVRKFNFI